MAKGRHIEVGDGAMGLRSDFGRREVVLPGGEAWQPSPMAGAERYMLDRIVGDVARATSIVRYAAGVRTHGGGQEFLVLAGSCHDGDDREGTYVRNPIGTAHGSWAGPDGAMLFLKLHQFTASDTRRVVVDTRVALWHRGLMPGLKVLPLHEHGREHVALVRWAPSTKFRRHQHWGGEEILVLDGVFEDEDGSYPRGGWLTQPASAGARPIHRALRRADLRKDRPPRRIMTRQAGKRAARAWLAPTFARPIGAAAPKPCARNPRPRAVPLGADLVRRRAITRGPTLKRIAPGSGGVMTTMHNIVRCDLYWLRQY